MSRFVLTAVGPDSYGIVARVTSALAELSCNLADSTMSNLSGHFAMILVVDGSPDIDEKSIYNAVQSRCAELSLLVDVKRIDGYVDYDLDGDRFVVSVYGTDRPGIVAGICEVLAAHHANIYDLTTRVIDTESTSIYTMVLEVALKDPSGLAKLESALSLKSSELGVSCSIRSSDSDEL
ncbi:MAG: ACT domain-containing protein [Actinomycetota bacterium]|nr:MAG: ACT domain-containing protein [Actinomycetota bacterium]